MRSKLGTNRFYQYSIDGKTGARSEGQYKTGAQLSGQYIDGKTGTRSEGQYKTGAQLSGQYPQMKTQPEMS
jgi:hypothetical protein